MEYDFSQGIKNPYINKKGVHAMADIQDVTLLCKNSYESYVPDQDGNYGDLNGNSSRQWLALYYTRDKKAGTPLLAPTENGHEMVVKVGSSETPGTGYSPLYMFGTPNVAQNLTFADGDNGYSYNDKKGGTYLYFSHANKVITYTGAAGVVIGVLGGFLLARRRRRS